VARLVRSLSGLPRVVRVVARRRRSAHRGPFLRTFRITQAIFSAAQRSRVPRTKHSRWRAKH
jgi:hypothetical protein